MYDINVLTPMLDFIIISVLIMSTVDKLIGLLKMYFHFPYESPFDSHNSKVLILPKILKCMSVSPGLQFSFVKLNISILFTLL